MTYLSVTGDKFEVPGTLGEQWAFDPRASYKDAPTVIRELIAIVAKGGNYLMNIGLDPTGVWAPAALATLAGMTRWFEYAGEAIHGSAPQWPYAFQEGGGGPLLYFTQAAGGPAAATYIMFWTLPASGIVTVSSYKPGTLRAPPARASRLTPAGAVAVPASLGPLGLALNMSGARGADLVALHTYYRLYNASRADRAPCGLRDCSVYTGDAYVDAGFEGACARDAAGAGEATVPLTLFYNGGTDNVGSVQAPGDGQAWAAVDSECFAYAADAPGGGGRWPLEVWHAPALGDYWTLASPASRALAQAQGYARVASLGFVGAVEPEPSVEEYAYVVKVEW